MKRRQKIAKVFEDSEIYVRAVRAREGARISDILAIKDDEYEQNLQLCLLCGVDPDGKRLWANEEELDADLSFPEVISVAVEACKLNGIWKEPDDKSQLSEAAKN